MPGTRSPGVSWYPSVPFYSPFHREVVLHTLCHREGWKPVAIHCDPGSEPTTPFGHPQDKMHCRVVLLAMTKVGVLSLNCTRHSLPPCHREGWKPVAIHWDPGSEPTTPFGHPQGTMDCRVDRSRVLLAMTKRVCSDCMAPGIP